MIRVVFVLSVLLFVARGPAYAAPGDADALLQRLASYDGRVQAHVFVGALPAAKPAVPLPAARVIGSVTRSAGRRGFTPSLQVYYDAAPSVFKTYEDELAAAGWKSRPFAAMVHRGGFVAQPAPRMGFYCKPGSPAITVTVPDAGSRDLRVVIASNDPSTSDVFCSGAMAHEFAAMQTPLPELSAPAGTQMDVSQAGNPMGASGAYLRHAAGLATLLEAFTNQFNAAGWSSGGAALNAAIGSRSFKHTDERGAHWQSVITIYAVDGKPGDFIAFVDITNIDETGARATNTARTVIDLP